MVQNAQNQIDSELESYINSVWQELKGYFLVLQHGDDHYVSSLEGSKEIIWVFKDWVENNGGWKDIQEARSTNREVAIHRWIHLGAKTYLENQNLDLSCETNIGVGQEDFKISRGNDKTVIEVKLSSNPDCKHGYEVQLPQYAQAENTKDMVFVMILVDDRKWDLPRDNELAPEIITINAKAQKSASRL